MAEPGFTLCANEQCVRSHTAVVGPEQAADLAVLRARLLAGQLSWRVATKLSHGCKCAGAHFVCNLGWTPSLRLGLACDSTESLVSVFALSLPPENPPCTTPVCSRRRMSIPLLSMLETMKQKSTQPRQMIQGLLCRILEAGVCTVGTRTMCSLSCSYGSDQLI